MCGLLKESRRTGAATVVPKVRIELSRVQRNREEDCGLQNRGSLARNNRYECEQNTDWKGDWEC